MKKLFFLRILTGVQYAVGLVLLSAIFFVLQAPQVAEFIILFVAGLPLLATRSSWFLNLPYSRKAIAAYVFAESVVFLLLAVASMQLVWFGLRSAGAMVDLTGEYEFICKWCNVFAFVTSLTIPIRYLNVGASFTNLDFNYYFNVLNRVKFKIALALGAIAVWYFFLLKAPLIYIGLLLTMLFFAPVVFFEKIRLPLEDLTKLSRLSRIAAGLAFLLTPALALTALHLAPAGPVTEASFVVVSELPYDLGEARQLELARSNRTTYWVEFKKLTEASKAAVTPEEWRARTAACEQSSCLDLSDHLIPEAGRADLNRFEALIEKCAPEVKSDGQVSCGKINLGRKRLERWYETLRRSQQLSEWLQSANTAKRFIALKALVAQDAPVDALAILKAQRDGADRMLASVATSTLEYHSGVGKWADRCADNDDKLEADGKAFCNRLETGDWSKRD